MIQPIQLNDGKPHHTIQCMVGLFISACLLFLFCHLRLEYQRCNISKYQCSRTSNRSHLETSAEQSDKSILINRLGYTLPQIISKSCERHRRSALCKFQKRLIPRAPSTTPVQTSMTIILPGRSLVLSINIWARTHIIPPTTNAFT